MQQFCRLIKINIKTKYSSQRCIGVIKLINQTNKMQNTRKKLNNQRIKTDQKYL